MPFFPPDRDRLSTTVEPEGSSELIVSELGSHSSIEPEGAQARVASSNVSLLGSSFGESRVSNAPSLLGEVDANRRLKPAPLDIRKKIIIRPSRRRSRAVKQSPDRFIPLRRSPTAPVKTYRMSKPLHKLNSTERLLRQRSASPDPFGPPTNNTQRHAERLSPARILQRRTNGLRPHPTAPTAISISHIPHPRPYREASIGSIWNVGGSAPAMEGTISGVPDGRGGVVSSGSTAPFFSSRFHGGVTTDQDQDSHEERLAMALDVDRSERILEFTPRKIAQQALDQLEATHGAGSPYVGRQSRDVRDAWSRWENVQWARAGAGARKYLLSHAAVYSRKLELVNA